MKVILMKGALRDAQEGLRWYRKRSDRAAENFISEIESSLDNILQDPMRYRHIDPVFRTFRMDTYPYSLIYRIVPGAIKVYAIAHDKRRPDYWRGRKA